MATERKQLNPAQRAALFNQLTREHIQVGPALTMTEGETRTVDLPKTRLLKKIRLLVEATINVTHATSTSYTAGTFAPYSLIKNLKFGLNNGFNPYQLNTAGLYLYNVMRSNADVITAAASGRGKVVQGLVASSSGTDNAVKCLVDLPIQINDRDPIGLILLQNEQTQGTLEITIADDVSILLSNTTGFTVTLEALKITPIFETFSIPVPGEAFPDITLLKLVQSYEQTIPGAGEHVIKLPTGNTYRRIALFLQDGNGAALQESDITSNFELSFNQADIPYVLPPAYVAAVNHEVFNSVLPAGVFVFDFTYQGLENYGGARDYIDTEKLTEFWVKFSTNKAGKVTYLREVMARLER